MAPNHIVSYSGAVKDFPPTDFEETQISRKFVLICAFRTLFVWLLGAQILDPSTQRRTRGNPVCVIKLRIPL